MLHIVWVIFYFRALSSEYSRLEWSVYAPRWPLSHPMNFAVHYPDVCCIHKHTVSTRDSEHVWAIRSRSVLQPSGVSLQLLTQGCPCAFNSWSLFPIPTLSMLIQSITQMISLVMSARLLLCISIYLVHQLSWKVHTDGFENKLIN